jgi:hypothetical protein
MWTIRNASSGSRGGKADPKSALLPVLKITLHVLTGYYKSVSLHGFDRS